MWKMIPVERASFLGILENRRDLYVKPESAEFFGFSN